jgi:endoglucanase
VKVVWIAGASAALMLSACESGAAVPSASRAGSLSPGAVSTVQSGEAQQVLQATWQSYTRTFISADGRVSDPTANDNTTSEGQSYAMLRAVWMNDRTTFDSVWRWTQQHLWQGSRFAFLWNGGVQDDNSATDADQDIALALIFASHQWQDASYLGAAHQVLQSVWSNDIATVRGVSYADAGNWAATTDDAGVVLDPSYFAPYAYRIFAAVDSGHSWSALVQSSYSALSACSQAPLGSGSAVGLPPDWCVVNRATGQVQSFAQKSNPDDYGYDAFRVMWRVALDALWFGSQSAQSYLAGQTFLRSQWAQRGALQAVYQHNGTPRSSYNDPTVYGGDIGAFLTDPSATSAILEQQLLGSLHQTGSAAYFGQADNYYEQNWVWFGIALATGRLPNLAAGA